MAFGAATMSERVKTLAPIRETTEDYDEAERRLKLLFKREIYFPILKELQEPQNILRNDSEVLAEALRSGRVTYWHGRFTGKFNAAISKKLKRLGAEWRKGAWYLPKSSLPMDVRTQISASEFYFQKKLEKIDQRLAQILPENVADKVKVADCFDRAIWKTDRSFRKSVEGLAIAPKLSPEARKKIADEWQNNMKLWIKDFTEKEIVRLRKDLQTRAFQGDRREGAVKTIQDSYGVSANKAKFLARQETSLLMTKFKETRYLDAGVKEYIWGCVAGTARHPVRPSHKILEGKIFRWDAPPVTTAPGEPQRRNNPGQDYNCRCFAKPIVRFDK
jgi:SPP1 gp7 family putative phage head morphogenesis protein